MVENFKNTSIHLASRPTGEPTHENFEIKKDVPLKPEDLKDGQILVRTLYLSLDPYMRGRMSAGKSYAAPLEIGDVMTGEAIAQVVQSKHADYSQGDIVRAYTGWQAYAIVSHDDPGARVRKVDTKSGIPLTNYLGVSGMPGFTAYVGLLEIGAPKKGETVVVAAASGAVGSVVGQIAKLKGCRVVGIAGGERKCKFVVQELGFDACIDHRAEDFAQQLASACSSGIDVYFENVGGRVFDAVLPLLNNFARVPVCGLVAQYSATSLPPGPDRTPLLMGNILAKRLLLKGFIVYDYAQKEQDFNREIAQWIKEGKIKYKEDIVTGLEKAPEAFMGLLKGQNFGKLIVKVHDV